MFKLEILSNDAGKQIHVMFCFTRWHEGHLRPCNGYCMDYIILWRTVSLTHNPQESHSLPLASAHSGTSKAAYGEKENVRNKKDVMTLTDRGNE